VTNERILAPVVTPSPGMERAGLFRAGQSLPPEILRDASKRIGAVSLTYAITYSTTFFIPLIVTALSGIDAVGGPVPVIAATVSIVASLIIFAYSRSTRLPAAALVDMGLLYNVVGSFGISMAEMWGVEVDEVVLTGHHWVGISWVCVWIIIFPVLVPSTPGKTLLSSFAAASMPPLVLLMSLAFGATAPVPGLFWAMLLLTTYLCAGIAFACSRIVYSLGARLEKAREMGNYRLVERLGSGGMGEVWRAQHRMLARPAAIKLIRREHLLGNVTPDVANLRKRFEREARATAALTSPHTIGLHDFGVTDEGQFYYVMELLEGTDLDSLIKRFGPLPAERVVHLLHQACESLADAHYHGVIHRDIKPANLYLCRLGPAVDFIKVLDFGLVKVFGQPSEEETRLTVEGIAAGTPAYMAPEMAFGSANLDPRADLYALACVGYVLLTGKLVFESDTPMGMLLHHTKTRPTPPSERTETAIPTPLENIILQCLEKDPDDRPGSAEELARMLERTGLSAAWTQERARDWWDLHLCEPTPGDEGAEPSSG